MHLLAVIGSGSAKAAFNKHGHPCHMYPRPLYSKGIEMALSKKKRVGKRTISAKQVKKTASGRKRHKSDGTQPPKTVNSTSTPAAS
jgi:hypothetical protein